MKRCISVVDMNGCIVRNNVYGLPYCDITGAIVGDLLTDVCIGGRESNFRTAEVYANVTNLYVIQRNEHLVGYRAPEQKFPATSVVNSYQNLPRDNFTVHGGPRILELMSHLSGFDEVVLITIKGMETYIKLTERYYPMVVVANSNLKLNKTEETSMHIINTYGK